MFLSLEQNKTAIDFISPVKVDTNLGLGIVKKKKLTKGSIFYKT